MAVDRQKTTPFFVRLFYRTGGFHRYAVDLTPVPKRHIHQD